MNISRPNMKYQLIAKDIHNDDKGPAHTRGRAQGVSSGGGLALDRTCCPLSRQQLHQPATAYLRLHPLIAEAGFPVFPVLSLRLLLDYWEYVFPVFPALCFNTVNSALSFLNFNTTLRSRQMCPEPDRLRPLHALQNI
ncbi:unnamed protein product [Boreogadus saida]